jgi:hypothetical protein
MFFVPIFVFRLLRMLVFTEATFTLNRMSEWTEAVTALGILIFVWLAFLRLTTVAPVQSTARVRHDRS